MGAYFCIGTCVICGSAFTFNPELVPSIEVKGSRREICQRCVEVANPQRVDKGLAPIVILPGAYEPAEEWPD